MKEPIYYSQDFTLISRAEAELYGAETAFRQDEYAAAEAAVAYARDLLKQVLAYDNMIPDQEDGNWMRRSDYEYLTAIKEKGGKV